MLRFRFFYEFLLANERPTAQEIKDEYLDTVSKVYYSYFRSYLQRLMKLKFATTATKTDMIGQFETVSNMATMSTMFSMSSMFSRSSTSTQLKQKETIFTLGNRNIVIESDLEASPIVPHAERIQDQARVSISSFNLYSCLNFRRVYIFFFRIFNN